MISDSCNGMFVFKSKHLQTEADLENKLTWGTIYKYYVIYKKKY